MKKLIVLLLLLTLSVFSVVAIHHSINIDENVVLTGLDGGDPPPEIVPRP